MSKPEITIDTYHPGNLVDYTYNGVPYGMQVTEDMCILHLAAEQEVADTSFAFGSGDPDCDMTIDLSWPAPEELDETQLLVLIQENHATQGNPY